MARLLLSTIACALAAGLLSNAALAGGRNYSFAGGPAAPGQLDEADVALRLVGRDGAREVPRTRVAALRPAAGGLADDGLAADRGIREHVELVAARGREFRHDRAVRARLEPVQRPRRDRELLAGAQHELRPSLDVKVHGPAAAAEGLLLAGPTAERRMQVLRARLARVQHELLRAVAVRVRVDEQLESDVAQPREAEVRHLDRRTLLVRDRDPGRLELRGRVDTRLVQLRPRDHA